MSVLQAFDEARPLIEQAGNILLTTHERTDGDDLGSVLALAAHLKMSGKQATVAIVGGVPAQLAYLPMSGEVREDIRGDEMFDLLIISGCSNKERCGNPKITGLQIPVINIDHHPDNKNYGTKNIVDPNKSSVAELVYDMFRYFGWKLTPGVSTCLLTGIFTDTGSFMHSNTGEATLQAAAELMKRGARVATVARHNYKGKNVEALKAWGKALENAYYDPEKKIIYSVVSAQELAELGNPPLEYFEGLVETLNKVPEAKYALFLKQEGEVVKGSLRSDPHKGTDVKEIAHQLGGGGHVWASGFSLVGRLIKNDKGKWQVV